MKQKFSIEMDAAPAPCGTNHERLFLVRLRKGSPADGAYDEELNGPALRAKLEEFLAANLSGNAYASSIDTLNNLLPAEYDHAADDEGDEDDEDDDSEAVIEKAVERVCDFIRSKLGDRARAADLDVAKALVRDEFRQRRLSHDRARRLAATVRVEAGRVMRATWKGRYRDQA